MHIATVELKPEPPFGSDRKLFEVAVLTLCWGRTAPEWLHNDLISEWLREWWANNKDNLPGSMDDEAIDALWFDKETRK